MGSREQRDLEYFKQLESGDTIRFRLDVERGEVTAFTVQLETYVDGRWRPMVRYDSAHDHPHRDELDWDGRVSDKTWLSPNMTYKEVVALARADLIANAPAYRAAFLERRP